jgi:signal peptidase II
VSADAAAPGSAWARRWPQLLIALGLVAADQVTKLLVVWNLDPGRPRVVIPGLFRLELLYNTGGVWSVGAGAHPTLQVLLFLILPLFVTLFAIWYSFDLPAEARARQACVALLVGGAVGNLVDRIRLRSVIDFLVFFIGEHEWPAFNLADSAICVGVFALLVSALFERRPERAASPGTP